MIKKEAAMGRPLLFCLRQRVIRTLISRLPLAVGAIFDGLYRTGTDTGHTVGTLGPPDGMACLQMDVVQRTYSGTFAAADTALCGAEGLCPDTEAIEQRIDRAGLHTIQNAGPMEGEGLTGPDESSCSLQYGVGCMDDGACFGCLRRAEHCNIVFWHDHLENPLIGQPYLAA